MNFINLIGIFFFLCLTKESYGNFLPCSDNVNCTTIVATASCAPGGYCQCQAGYVFTTDFTQCIEEAFYGASCTDDVQCSHMLTGAYCDTEETNTCACRDGLTYIRGRCRKLVNLNEHCDDDIDCNFNFDRESVICLNNVCTCSDGFYLRTENVCRRISMNYGDPCIVNTDCQGSNLYCLEANNTCQHNTVAIQTELYSLPQTNSVSTQTGGIPSVPPVTTKLKADDEDEEEEEDAKFGDKCTNEGQECSGLAHSICRANLCRCKPGYYFQTGLCKAELGESAVGREYCPSTTIDYRNGRCLCNANLFGHNDLKRCVKASTGYGKGCTQHSQCTPYGFAYCTSTSPKECHCYPYAEYNADTQFCVKKVGYEEYCTASNQCTLPNTVCSNENTCVCAPNYLAIDKVCRPGAGAECANTDECGFGNSECVANDKVEEEEGGAEEEEEEEVPKTICKCKTGFVYHNSDCIPEVPHEEACDVDEQCKPLLGELSTCKNSTCLCEDGAHFKDDKCHTKIKLGETCTKPGECFVEENPERVVCRNSVCNCKFDYSADVEKQQCIVVKSNPKNSSGRPSPLKVITIILMTSAALITSAAIREAYFLR